MMDKYYYINILASSRNGTLYVGFTSSLPKRIWEHKNEVVESFTKKYQVHMLVYYEVYENKQSALEREKLLKRWHRKWKLQIIEKFNPGWKDLYNNIV